jgi:hypothetical protein
VRWWEAFVIFYGITRVIEIFVYQINVLLFDEFRAKKAGNEYAIQGFRRIVVLLLHNYIEIIFWFAIFYRNAGWAFKTLSEDLDSFFVSLNFSFVTMTNFGHTVVSSTTIFGYILVFVQSVIGLFMTLLIIARFISLLPKPDTLDESER